MSKLQKFTLVIAFVFLLWGHGQINDSGEIKGRLQNLFDDSPVRLWQANFYAFTTSLIDSFPSFSQIDQIYWSYFVRLGLFPVEGKVASAVVEEKWNFHNAVGPWLLFYQIRFGGMGDHLVRSITNRPPTQKMILSAR